MLRLAQCMIVYGLVLLVCDALDAFTGVGLGFEGGRLALGWVGGAIMIFAGLASMQGRRSLRISGLCIGIFVPLTLAAVFAWDSARLWRRIVAEHSSVAPGISITAMALASMLVLWAVYRLMPRESIASRGYSVSIPSVKRSDSVSKSTDQKPRRSEAG